MDGTSVSIPVVVEPARSARPSVLEIFGCFRKALPESFFNALKQSLNMVENSCVFTLPVTTWLMILQRLCRQGTLSTAVSELLQGHGRQLLQPCRQVRENRISSRTGAYSQARQRMPEAAARCVAEHTFQSLHHRAPQHGLAERLFLLDGTSIRLAHAEAVLRCYPPAENQYGRSHWPVLRVAVLHHVRTALAMAPEFGPMYGEAAVSEQQLAERLIARLPAGAVLIADRNFGVFSVAWCAYRQQHAVLVRLTEQRARALSGGPLLAGSDTALPWRPSRDDRRAHPELPAEAVLHGRLIVARPEGRSETLCLFTTLREAAAEVAALYKQRWNIETDLRSLKNEVRLHTIPARSPQLVAVELFMAVAAYNLIRALMAEAAQQTGIEPRRLSFSRSRDALWAFVRAVSGPCSGEQFEQHWRILIRCLCEAKLPHRPNRSSPRAVWPRPQNFPSRKASQS